MKFFEANNATLNQLWALFEKNTSMNWNDSQYVLHLCQYVFHIASSYKKSQASSLSHHYYTTLCLSVYRQIKYAFSDGA